MTRKRQRHEVEFEKGELYGNEYKIVEVKEQVIKSGNGLGCEPYGAYHDGTKLLVEDTCENCGCNRALINVGFIATTHACVACDESPYEDNVMHSEFL